MAEPSAADFDSWVAARGPALLRLAYTLTGNAADAEDVVQEALARALPRWDRISRVDDVDAYVRRMVVNAHTSWWRRFRRRESPVEPSCATRSVPPNTARLRRPAGRLWLACQALPEVQRTAVVLRYYEQLEYAEIADLTGVREGSVRSRVSRGLAALATRWEKTTMSDLEGRLTEALRDDAGTPRTPSGWPPVRATGARPGAAPGCAVRRPRRVAVLAVAVGVGRAGRRRRPGPAPAPTAVDPAAPVRDGRWESWHGVTVEVPGSWEYGDLATGAPTAVGTPGSRAWRGGRRSPARLARRTACVPGDRHDQNDEPFDWPVVTQTGDTWPRGTSWARTERTACWSPSPGPTGTRSSPCWRRFGRSAAEATPTAARPRTTSVQGWSVPVVSVCRFEAPGHLVRSELCSLAPTRRRLPQACGAAGWRVRPCCRTVRADGVRRDGREGNRVEVRDAGNHLCADRGVFVTPSDRRTDRQTSSTGR